MERPVTSITSFAAAGIVACLAFLHAGGAAVATLRYVDDNGPFDPAPGNPDTSDPSENGSQNHPFDAIQEAIDVSSDDDTIIVRDGTYTGEGNWDIDFGGKAIHLRSENGPTNCIIDCEEERHRVFYFHSGEDETSIVEGFTVKNGRATSAGGIYCSESSPTITKNIITGNAATNWYGGGIYCNNSSPTITNNVITNNEASFHGGGVYCSTSAPRISNNTITQNSATYSGGGVYCYSSSSPTISNNTIAANNADSGGGINVYYFSSPTIVNNTITGNGSGSGGGISCTSSSPAAIANNIITGNKADGTGGALYCSSSTPTIAGNTFARNRASDTGGIFCTTTSSVITNCIVWDNGDDVAGCGTTYSCIQDGDEGTGNIDDDPLFADPGQWDNAGTPADPSDDVWENGDYHLQSQYGRWDPTANAGAGDWVYDGATSPCIDKGDPGSDYSNEPMPNFGRINMGAYGNTAEASKSGWNIRGDANDDCRVNILDLIFVRNRLNQNVDADQNWKADLNADGKINILDLIAVRNNLNARCI